MNSTYYFTDVKSYISDRNYETKRFIYRNTKKTLYKIDTLHRSIKEVINEKFKIVISIVCANLLINLVFFILIFVLKN